MMKYSNISIKYSKSGRFWEDFCLVPYVLLCPTCLVTHMILCPACLFCRMEKQLALKHVELDDAFCA